MPFLILGVIGFLFLASRGKRSAGALPPRARRGRRGGEPRSSKPAWVRWQSAQAVRTCDPDVIEQTAAMLEQQGYDADGKILRHIASLLERAPAFVRAKACSAVHSNDARALAELAALLERSGEHHAADVVRDIAAILTGEPLARQAA